MTTPLVTIADALIEFILSLLRDPNAAAEFAASPEDALERGGLSDICGEDVRAVVPIIVDHPSVQPRPPAPHPEPHPITPRPPTVIEEITRVANNFHIDNRSMVVDQSINQSIWADGDVMQIFDHEANIAFGDNAMAAGNDATVDSSSTDTTIGDVSVGNHETNTAIDGSFNDQSTNTDVDLTVSADESFNDQSVEVEVDTEIEDSFQNTETTVVDTDIAASSVTVEAPEPMAAAAPTYEEYQEDSSDDYSDAGDEYVDDMDYDEA